MAKSFTINPADLDRAMRIIGACEDDLGRRLSPGERRDLLKDNTAWPSDYVAAVVAALLRDHGG